MKCEKCKKDHNGEYGSGRFCSQKCARSFSTKEKRVEINEKVSKKLKGKKVEKRNQYDRSNWSEEKLDNYLKGCKKGGKKGSKTINEKRNKKYQEFYENKQFEKLQGKTGKPILFYKNKIKEEQKNKCNMCNNDTWNDLPILLEIHHIDGNPLNNIRENLEGLCPNCHSQTPNWRFKKRESGEAG